MKLNNHLNTLGYARRLFFKRTPSPIYVILFVTERCNAKCKHCFVGCDEVTAKRTEMTLDEYEKTSRHMGNLLYLLPTGGEPFLRGDLPEIIGVFYRNNRLRNVGIPTNGSLTGKVAESVSRILSQWRIRLENSKASSAFPPLNQNRATTSSEIAARF